MPGMSSASSAAARYCHPRRTRSDDKGKSEAPRVRGAVQFCMRRLRSHAFISPDAQVSCVHAARHAAAAHCTSTQSTNPNQIAVEYWHACVAFVSHRVPKLRGMHWQNTMRPGTGQRSGSKNWRCSARTTRCPSASLTMREMLVFDAPWLIIFTFTPSRPSTRNTWAPACTPWAEQRRARAQARRHASHRLGERPPARLSNAAMRRA